LKIKKYDRLIVCSAFWAWIWPQTFLKVRPESSPFSLVRFTAFVSSIIAHWTDVNEW